MDSELELGPVGSALRCSGGQLGVVRSGGEARLAFAGGEDWLGCYWVALLCALLRYSGVIVGVSWRADNGASERGWN